MASTFSPSLKLELIATGEQSGTWGATTNTNLGTLLEQAIAGFLSKAQGDVANLTLTSLDGASDEARNMVIDITGALTAARNVVVPTAEKFYLFKNSTTGGYAITVKTSGGSGVSIAAGTAQLVYCDGTNVVQGLSGTLAVQAAASVAITGGTIAGLTTLTMASGAATPATNDAAALGTSTLMWSDLFLASGGVINWNNGDVLVTHSANTLAFTGASSGYTYDAALLPSANDAAALGASATSWADLFLASGGVIDFNAGNYTLTHSAGLLTANGALSIGTSNALTAGTIELGAATDTTISRGAAGFIAVEGNRVPSPASQASGDILYRGATEWERLAKGTAAQVLTMNAGATAPEWAAPTGGWALISSNQPTTDVADVTFTGLSGYSRIRLEWVLQNTGTGGHGIAFGGRTSGGTWRDSGTIFSNSSNGNWVTAGSIEINNFNSASAVFKIGSVVGYIAALALDNTSATATVNWNATTNLTQGGSVAWAWMETWDELRIKAVTSNFEGSTSAQRGYVYVYGMV